MLREDLSGSRRAPNKRRLLETQSDAEDGAQGQDKQRKISTVMRDNELKKPGLWGDGTQKKRKLLDTQSESGSSAEL